MRCVLASFLGAATLAAAPLSSRAQPGATPPAPAAAPQLSPDQQQRLAEANELAAAIDQLHKQAKYREALPLVLKTLAAHREVLGMNNPKTAMWFNNAGYFLQHAGDYAESRKHYEQSLAIRQTIFGEKHPETALLLYDLGSLSVEMGDYAAAQTFFARSLEIQKEVLGPQHPATAASLNGLGQALQYQGDVTAARACFEKALSIREQVLGEQHAATAVSLNNVGFNLASQGDYAAARSCYERALAIHRKLLGENHPQTASSLNNLGCLSMNQGRFAEAQTCLEQAVAIARKSLGEAHAVTARYVNNLGGLYKEQGDLATARRLYEQALAVRQATLGPQHSDTAQSVDNLGMLLLSQGNYDEAHALIERALASYRQSLGADHPETITALGNLAIASAALEQWDDAFGLFARALDQRSTLRDAVFEAASEAEALNYCAAEGLLQDRFLAAAWHSARPAAALYEHLWPGRAAVFDLSARRARYLEATIEPEAQAVYRQWLDVRHEVARLTLAGGDPTAAAQAVRRQRLAAATKQKEQLERDLASRSALFARHQDTRGRPSSDLLAALPRESVFIDLLRYARLEHDANTPGRQGDSWTISYVAFVLSPAKTISRIDLGPAAPIDAAAAAWRKSILEGESSSASADLRRMLWAPIENCLAEGVRTIYLTPAGDLALIPWPALPGKQPGTVLLEHYALAVVPNGRFLLDQLTLPARSATGPGNVLAVGGVSYNSPPESGPLAPPAATGTPFAPPAKPASSDAPSTSAAQRADLDSPGARGTFRAPAVDETTTRAAWPDLPGTLVEVDELARLAADRPLVKLTGPRASTARVLQELLKARYAALATHGFFADPKFRSAFQLDDGNFERQLIMRGERTTAAGRNPLVLSGLVFAGANLPRTKDEWEVPQGDGGILTAEAIAGLPLHDMQLAVLSACETGLGDVAGGEGVLGLQRAFHVAGCRNVVASLWKVDDQATMALMRLYYQKLWQQHKTPLAALRDAQLALYRHPEQIVTLAASRGLDLSQPAKLADAPRRMPRSGSPRGADIRHWAAFVLSGLGD